ncbi:DUF2529 family protein [Sporosarcina sp. FA9]|uniref:DUF2529 family protein n=1 Tax=Sporosarcina sp. FA9 TaxID=3413030 RepID=UPI003F65D583
MKMLTTQISGLLQRIGTNNTDSIEETARLLAQATIGEGRVILASFDEMEAVYLSAKFGVEPFENIHPYVNEMSIGKADRVWIFSRNETDLRVLELARRLASEFIPFATVASRKPDVNNELADLSTTYVYTGLVQGLLPGEDNTRIVQPHSLAALFIYEAVKLSYDEMLSDE